ncbi:hypothetical protein [Nitratireductor sp. OM-1]|uniref:hypothetical protein n=1 Tax=Nitratireductor sp. OM-1 TaxID=1756988 RepID=UPI000DE00404|nr:hypothetical protein [Nitratireductor sp. OM-1]
MNLMNSQNPFRTITAESNYSPEYRFRLWQALVDDISLLKVGYRAYYSHMMRSFRDWKSGGVKFVHPNGAPINLDELTRDDLYGFLGKEHQRPLGPSRNIHHFKFAVIDVFFKTKYPVVARAFADDGLLESLGKVATMFYGQANIDGDGSSYSNSLIIHDQLEGVYVRESVSWNKIYKDTHISAYIIKNSESPFYAKIKKLYFPTEEICIASAKSKAENVNWAEYNNSRIITYDGICFPNAIKSGEPNLTCMMRDVVEYTSYTSSIQLSASYGEEGFGPYSQRSIRENVFPVDRTKSTDLDSKNTRELHFKSIFVPKYIIHDVPLLRFNIEDNL